MTSRRFIYLDHAATTPLHPDVLAAMMPYFTDEFGNPGGLYSLGQRAREAIESARRSVAKVLGCASNEIIFTSGGTESDNLAIRGVVLATPTPNPSPVSQRRGTRHIITSAVEHHAVGHTCQRLRDQFGCELTEVRVDQYGQVDPDDVRKAIQPNTALVSIMTANNEVGTIQPIAEIGRIAREHGIPFHTDAVQAAAYLPLNVNTLNVDLLSLGAHKFYGPKGVGVLYVRRGTPLTPTQTGGGHEGERRAGTENVPYIVGMAKAFEMTQIPNSHPEPVEGRKSASPTPQSGAREARVGDIIPKMRGRLLAEIPQLIKSAFVTGHPTERLPHNASFVIEGVEAGPVLLALDLAGIAASSGAACTSATMAPSHVLTAMGVPRELAAGALRLTLGRENTMEEIDVVVETVAEVVGRLRKMKA